jgi:hypothetical protein
MAIPAVVDVVAAESVLVDPEVESEPGLPVVGEPVEEVLLPLVVELVELAESPPERNTNAATMRAITARAAIARTMRRRAAVFRRRSDE